MKCPYTLWSNQVLAEQPSAQNRTENLVVFRCVITDGRNGPEEGKNNNYFVTILMPIKKEKKN